MITLRDLISAGQKQVQAQMVPLMAKHPITPQHLRLMKETLAENVQRHAKNLSHNGIALDSPIDRNFAIAISNALLPPIKADAPLSADDRALRARLLLLRSSLRDCIQTLNWHKPVLATPHSSFVETVAVRRERPSFLRVVSNDVPQQARGH